MILNILAIIIFLVPGFATEFHYLMLINKEFEDNRFLSIVRGLSFSLIILLARCVMLAYQGNQGVLINDMFSTVERIIAYGLVAAVIFILLPNVYFLIQVIYSKIMSKFIEK